MGILITHSLFFQITHSYSNYKKEAFLSTSHILQLLMSNNLLLFHALIYLEFQELNIQEFHKLCFLQCCFLCSVQIIRSLLIVNIHLYLLVHFQVLGLCILCSDYEYILLLAEFRQRKILFDFLKISLVLLVIRIILLLDSILKRKKTFSHFGKINVN